MKRYFVLLMFLVSLFFNLNVQGQEPAKKETTTNVAAEMVGPEARLKTSSETKYVPVDKYDPLRDTAKDIDDALTEAKRTNRRVLLEVGGLWCIWCRHMDDFFEKQPAVLALREKHFVTLKVNYSDENKNEAILSQYPKVAGYPHIFVLDFNGKLLHSQDTSELEQGKGYDLNKFTDFLKKWANASPEKTSM